MKTENQAWLRFKAPIDAASGAASESFPMLNWATDDAAYRDSLDFSDLNCSARIWWADLAWFAGKPLTRGYPAPQSAGLNYLGL